jgi:hypothetical protein
MVTYWRSEREIIPDIAGSLSSPQFADRLWSRPIQWHRGSFIKSKAAGALS